MKSGVSIPESDSWKRKIVRVKAKRPGSRVPSGSRELGGPQRRVSLANTDQPRLMETGHGEADSTPHSTPDMHESRNFCASQCKYAKMCGGLVCPKRAGIRTRQMWNLGDGHQPWVVTQDPKPKSQQRSTECPGTRLCGPLQHRTARTQMVASKPEVLSHSIP